LGSEIRFNVLARRLLTKKAAEKNLPHRELLFGERPGVIDTVSQAGGY
jgi:hypothetical protein